MADKIKAIKIKQKNGTYSEEVPISVNVQNVQWDENNHTLLDALGSVDISSSGKGNLQHQIDELDGDKISTNQFNSRLNNFLREQISEDTTDWLDDNVNPVGSAVIVDKTLTINGAAADAKVVGDEFTAVKADLTKLADITPIPDNSDLNNYIETGLYSIEYGNYTILNYPPVDQVASYLEVRKMTTGYVGQKLTIPGNGKVFTRRRFNNGQWNNWIQIPTPDTTLSQSGVPADAKAVGDELSDIKADLAILADVTPIPDNSDLNDYVNTGLYTIEYGNYTILHYPTDTIVASYLEVTALTTGYIAQKLTQAGTGKVFTRRRFNNGQWNNWIQITGLEPGNGLSEDVKNALIACFANVEWAGSSPNGNSYISALKNALGMTVSKTFTYPSGGLGSTGGRIQTVSSSDRTATINTTALQTCTVGARVANADTANLALNGIYGIKQGSFTKIKYYATTTSTNSGAHFNIGCVICKIIDGVYTIRSMTSTQTATAPNGVQVDLPKNPDDDNYILLKVEGVNTNARTELAALEMVLTEGSSTPSTPASTQEIAFTPNLNIMAEMSITPELVIRSISQRQSFGAISDEPKIIAYPSLSPSNYSLIRVPSGKTTVTVTCVTSARCNLAWFDLTDTYQGNPYYHFINQTGWQTKANTFTFDITGKEYIAINFESTDSNSSNYTLTMS